MAMREREVGARPEGAPEQGDVLLLEAKEEGRGGLSGKYHQIESLVRALEGLPKDVEWGNAGLNELTLAALESIGVAGSINEIGRLDYYASSSAGGLAGAMLRSIDDWQDGGAVFRKRQGNWIF